MTRTTLGKSRPAYAGLALVMAMALPAFSQTTGPGTGAGDHPSKSAHKSQEAMSKDDPKPTDQDAQDHLSIRAMTDHSGMHPGDSGLLAIEIEVDDGWHTYWPGVSDTGYGISFEIDAPKTITLDEPIWPTPKRYLQKGNILDNTYEGTVTVLVPFRVAKDAKPDTVVLFDIRTSYLVCDEICLPGTGSTSTTLTILDAGAQAWPSASHGAIKALFDKRPRPFDEHSDDVRVQWISKAAALMFRDATRIEFFPATDCSELAQPITDTVATGNRLEIRFTQAQNKALSGRVRVHSPRGVTDYDINLKAPKG